LILHLFVAGTLDGSAPRSVGAGRSSREHVVMGSFDALGTATSGLRAQSFALQNISDNIANSQTTAFKSTGTSFADILDAQASGLQLLPGVGGVEAMSAASNNIQGAIQNSTTGTFMAVNGNGYFTVAKPSGFSNGQPVFDGTKLYTRRGDFQPDGNGFLVNGAGYYLMGAPIDPATGNAASGAPQVLQFNANTTLPGQNGGPAGTLQTISTNANGQITGTFSNGQTAALAAVPLAGFRGENSLQKLDGEAFAVTARSGPALTGASGKVVGSAIEASNTDVADQLTKLIETQQAYNLDTKLVTTNDQMLQTLTNLTV
jgi:flagellar hook protein FlgE